MPHSSPSKPLQILAISGSLRTGSSNTAVLRATAVLAPPNVEVIVYNRIADLPHFNPDLDGEAPPLPVTDFRVRLRACDGVLISSPEYAHGVPGVLKNALDWLVGSGEFVGKPVALINASPRATHAQASLTQTLTVMMARLVTEAFVTVSLASNKLADVDVVSNPELSRPLRSAVAAFARAIEAGRAEARS